MNPSFRIESLLAARQFLVSQLVGERLYFVSDLSGRLSLYAMRVGGSVPEPLLPPQVALQSPHHLPGLFYVLPRLGKLVAGDDASYRYLAESIRMHPGQEELRGLMKQCGFGHVDCHNLSAGVVALHVGIKC